MAQSDSSPTCPECGGFLRLTATETVCEDCGLVLGEDPIDRGPEWRSFADDDTDRRRTGAPLTRSRHDRGLSTKIGYGTDSVPDRSTRITGRKRRQLSRLRREHTRATISSKAEYNQVLGFTEIKRITARLSLPDCLREQACALFDSAQSENLLQGRSIEGFAAACVYASCRVRSLPRTIDEVVTIAAATEAELKAAYDALNRDLGLPTGPIDPGQYLPRFASNLDLDTAVERRAREHLDALVTANRIGGRNPSGVAAACLYKAACDCPHTESITQTAAAEVADVATVTIRSTLTELRSLSADS